MIARACCFSTRRTRWTQRVRRTQRFGPATPRSCAGILASSQPGTAVHRSQEFSLSSQPESSSDKQRPGCKRTGPSLCVLCTHCVLRDSRRFQLLFQQLLLVQLRVQTAVPDELVVRAALDDAALVEDENLIGIPNGRNTMRDDDGGPFAHQAAET